MSFWLQVDGPRWRNHAAQVLAEYRDAATETELVPVVKANGYGLGQGLAAREAAELGANVLAVGTVLEAIDPALDWSADLLVLTPFDPRDEQAQWAWEQARQQFRGRLITTVADPAALAELVALAAREGRPETPARVVLEGLTSVHRFGMTPDQLRNLLADPTVRGALTSGIIQLDGLALHLPLAEPQPGSIDPLRMWGQQPTGPALPGSGRAQEVAAWGLQWTAMAAGLTDVPAERLANAATLWVSHVQPSDLRQIRQALPDVPIRPRVGTALWLGEPTALQAYGTVLAAHTSAGGVGYRQRRLKSGATLLVVGGGTSHGVALAAPDAAVTLRRKLQILASGAQEASGHLRSPFTLDGQYLRFVEPPHASVSMIQVPPGTRVPPVGSALPCRVRNTTARFDRVIGLD